MMHLFPAINTLILFLALILPLPLAISAQSTISTDKTSYNVGEPITITWDYPKNDASNGDRITLYDDSALSGGTVSPSSFMWVYAKSLTQTYQKGKRSSGSVTFDDDPSVGAWPLGVGTYQVHIARDANAPPYSVVVSSANFTVTPAGTSSPTTNPTSSPSQTPSKQPSGSPMIPTLSPTSNPTRAPVPATLSPSASPTKVATKSPTGSPVSPATVIARKTDYAESENIIIDFAYPDNPELDAWIGIWPANSDPGALPSPSPYWNYICSNNQDSLCPSHPTSGDVTLDSGSAGGEAWPLTCGSWRAHLIANGVTSSSHVSVASSEIFTIGGYTTCESLDCNASPEDATSASTHLPPTEGARISKIAFGSCFWPRGQKSGSALWQHVRDNFGSDSIWNWLGDNMYMDTDDSQLKRDAYYKARTDRYYATYGPNANPKIPVTGLWDDHDFGANNDGDNYECKQSSQNEFAYHFNLPSTDPRHPGFAGGQQEGIYSSNMFTTDSGASGIHLINLDNRYHRSPTFSTYGDCQGAASTILGAAQWAWLEAELSRPSEIKVIGSGIQVLPPTNRGRQVSEYCAYDGAGGTFDQSNSDIGEGTRDKGTTYENWAEIPQERTRLLRLVQECINAGNAKHIIFTSGDQHWAEMMVKEIPARTGQPAVTVYEVTASGIDQNYFRTTSPNSNRLRPEDYGYRVRRNLKGRAQKGQEVSPKLTQRKLPKEPSASAIKSITYSGNNICGRDALYICTAIANYGGIEVDWANAEIHLMIFTPFTSSAQENARVTLDLSIASSAAIAGDESVFE